MMPLAFSGTWALGRSPLPVPKFCARNPLRLSRAFARRKSVYSCLPRDGPGSRLTPEDQNAALLPSSVPPHAHAPAEGSNGDGVSQSGQDAFNVAKTAKVFGRVCRLLLPIAVVAFVHFRPLAAASLTVPTLAGNYEQTGFISGLASSFALVLVSEIGDKTFFISALLAMKYSRTLVLLGTMLALGSMTVISVGIGQVFHALPSSFDLPFPVDDYAAAALLVWFGIQGIRDGLAMKDEDDEELRDAEEVVEGIVQKEGERSPALRVVSETSSLVFLAEWGDKSMLATVALAAAKSPLGVIVGGVSGHLVASLIAVIGGSFLGKYVSERTARLVGGVLFLIFAALTIFNLF